LQARRPGARHGPANLDPLLTLFERGALADPVAELSLLEVLGVLARRDQAIPRARQLLARLLDQGFPASALDTPAFPPGYTTFRVEWERAAWMNAGSVEGERRAKEQLLIWRLHELLAGWTGELLHHHEAALA